MGSLAGVFLSVHTPRYCTLEAAFEGKLASEVFRPVRDGLVAQGKDVAEARLDVMAINSCHLISTFPTVVDGTPRHQGVLTAQEAPEIIHGVAYDYPGDYGFASALVARGKSKDHLAVLANDVHYPLDYGTVMPMVCYLDRAQRLPMVPISVCLSSDLDECFAGLRLRLRGFLVAQCVGTAVRVDSYRFHAGSMTPLELYRTRLHRRFTILGVNFSARLA